MNCPKCNADLSVGTTPNTQRIFSKLPRHIQSDIGESLLGHDNPPSESELAELDKLSPENLFDAWCEWNGLVNWSRTILAAHKEIFK